MDFDGNEMDYYFPIENHLPDNSLFVIYRKADWWGTFVNPCTSWINCAHYVSMLYGKERDRLKEDLMSKDLVFSQPIPHDFYDMVSMWDRIIQQDNSYMIMKDVSQEQHLQIMATLVNIPVGKYLVFCQYHAIKDRPDCCYFYFTDDVFPLEYILEQFKPHDWQLDESKAIITGKHTTYCFSNREQAVKAYRLLSTSGQ